MDFGGWLLVRSSIAVLCAVMAPMLLAEGSRPGWKDVSSLDTLSSRSLHMARVKRIIPHHSISAISSESSGGSTNSESRSNSNPISKIPVKPIIYKGGVEGSSDDKGPPKHPRPPAATTKPPPRTVQPLPTTPPSVTSPVTTNPVTTAPVTRCITMQTCSARDLLGNASALYDLSINFSREFLLTFTLPRAELDVREQGGNTCADITSQNDTTINFDINALPAIIVPPGNGGRLVLNTLSSADTPLRKTTAVYTGIESESIGQYRIVVTYASDGQTVENTQRFLRLPNTPSDQFLPFPLIQEECSLSEVCGVSPPDPSSFRPNPPTLLPPSTILPSPSFSDFNLLRQQISSSHCSLV